MLGVWDYLFSCFSHQALINRGTLAPVLYRLATGKHTAKVLLNRFFVMIGFYFRKDTHFIPALKL